MLLSKKFTNERYLIICVIGLGMKKDSVDRHINNKQDICTAAYKTFNDWIKSQSNKREAYINMCKGLRHKNVNMKLYVTEALQDDNMHSQDHINLNPTVDVSCDPDRKLPQGASGGDQAENQIVTDDGVGMTGKHYVSILPFLRLIQIMHVLNW